MYVRVNICKMKNDDDPYENIKAIEMRDVGSLLCSSCLSYIHIY